ncbi:hypothetical protein WMF04_39890 [Sorangium sp. So ce260]|uniref:hypothetical protein n=1 Tax=Sorangium sp. So ce260 TaxID=3133291 RepID=UPI003F62197C
MTEPVPTAPIVVSFQGGALRVVGIERPRGALFRLGLTATPERADGRGYDDLVVALATSEQRVSDERREHVAYQ